MHTHIRTHIHIETPFAVLYWQTVLPYQVYAGAPHKYNRKATGILLVLKLYERQKKKNLLNKLTEH